MPELNPTKIRAQRREEALTKLETGYELGFRERGSVQPELHALGRWQELGYRDQEELRRAWVASGTPLLEFVAQLTAERAAAGIDATSISATPQRVRKIPLNIRALKLVGGSATFRAGSSIHLVIAGDDLEIKSGFRTMRYPVAHVTARAESQQEFTSRVTATRVLAIGIFALAAKKKTAITHQYLTLTIDDGAHQQDLVFETDRAAKLAYALQEHGGRARQAADGAVTDSEPAPIADTENIADKLRQVAELHQSGILADSEYEAKKAELLARL